MRDIDRIEPLLGLIKLLWIAYPDMRLGQLIYNAAAITGWGNKDIFYLEDDQLYKGIKELMNDKY